MGSELKRSAAKHILASVAVAVTFVAAAAMLTVIVQLLSTRVYFILFVPAVMLSTWYGGGLSGVFASALTVVASVLLLPRAEVADQLAWLVVSAMVISGISALTAARRQAEARLTAYVADERAKRLSAESLSALKTDLLAQLAHELRQPLSAIAVAARLLETDQPEPSRKRAIGVIGRQSAHLGELLDELLDLSKLTRRELQLRPRPIDLCEVIDDSLHSLDPSLTTRRLAVSSSLPDAPVQVVADPVRIRQVISNLVSNAVKFTPDGGRIDVAVERGATEIVIRVRDTGRGIAPESLQAIFEMFHKGDGEGVGLGIGLALVKGLTELHGGSVEARSDGVGRGSEFIVRLPARGARDSGVPMSA